MEFDERTKKQVLTSNIYGDVTEDTYVWRIFSAQYFFEDLKNDCMTMVMPCYDTQNDVLENPLRDSISDIEGQKYKLFLNMMSHYYTQSWSLRPDISWNHFGTVGDKVRVKCKAYNLFDNLMNISDRFYMLNYHMAKIKYDHASSIQQKYNDKDYESFLESSGLALVESLMILQNKWVQEEEVRLLYDYQPQHNNTFPFTHKIHGNINQFCSHVFDWQDVIEEYEFDSSNSNDQSGLESWLTAYGAKKK